MFGKLRKLLLVDAGTENIVREIVELVIGIGGRIRISLSASPRYLASLESAH